MRKYAPVLFIAGALMSPFASEAARETPPTWWLNLGSGAGANFNSLVNGEIAAGELSFNGTLSEHGFLTLYSAGVGEKYDAGIMYGYVSRKPSSYWSASAGICYYEVLNSYWEGGRYRADLKHNGAGIPLEVQAFWTPFNHFGFGFLGHAVASEHPSTTGMLAIQVF